MKAMSLLLEVVIILIITVIMIFSLAMINNQFFGRAETGAETIDPNAAENAFDEFRIPSLKIDKMIIAKEGAELTVGIDINSSELVDSDINIIIRSYPDNVVKQYQESRIIQPGVQRMFFKTTIDDLSAPTYFLIAELRTMSNEELANGKYINRMGVWMDGSGQVADCNLNVDTGRPSGCACTINKNCESQYCNSGTCI